VGSSAFPWDPGFRSELGGCATGMNAQRVPISFGAALRSASFVYQTAQAQQEDEELSNPYTTIEDAYTFQEAYDAKGARGVFRGAASRFGSMFFKPAQARETPAHPPDGRWFLDGKEVKTPKRGLLHSLTPNFLRDDEDDDFASACCPQLGFKQRVFGCVCCFVLGQLVQFCSFGSVAGVLIGRPGRFAFLYTLGNVTMLSASFFLSGPRAQCRKITSKDRAKTSFVYICSMLLTLSAVFSPAFFGRSLLILVCVVVQWVALVWYVLSFVPYGHTVGRRFLRQLGSCLFRC